MKDIVYFFDEQFVKENAVIDDNVNGKVLRFAMRTAQEVTIQSYLGSDLYKDMLACLKDDPTLNTKPDYKTLIDDYIQQAYLFATLAELPTWMSFKFTNKSLTVKTDEWSDNADRDDISFVRKEAQTRASWYLERMKEYICANDTKYPLYYNSTGDTDRIAPKKQTFVSPMFLDR